jgi:hypothetical protein
MSVLHDIARTIRPAPGDRHGPLPPMLVTLTVVTGLVDAASYLKLGHAMLLGALAGALLAVHVSVAATLAVALALAVAVALAAHAQSSSDAAWTRG